MYHEDVDRDAEDIMVVVDIVDANMTTTAKT